MTLTGTEKQVAWAEDIRTRYANLLVSLKETEEILRDVAQTEKTMRNPIAKTTVTVKRYAREIADSHRAAIASASNLAPKTDGNDINWKVDRAKEYGDNPHANRLADADHITATIANIETALATEEQASFWIENR